MRTPSLEGPIAERNEGVSKLNLVKSAIWCLRRQFKISWWFCSIFLEKEKKKSFHMMKQEPIRISFLWRTNFRKNRKGTKIGVKIGGKLTSEYGCIVQSKCGPINSIKESKALSLFLTFWKIKLNFDLQRYFFAFLVPFQCRLLSKISEYQIFFQRFVGKRIPCSNK